MALKVAVFAAAFVLFVPVRWYVWGTRLRDHRWRFLDSTFGQIVDRERARALIVVPIEAVVLAVAVYFWA